MLSIAVKICRESTNVAKNKLENWTLYIKTRIRLIVAGNITEPWQRSSQWNCIRMLLRPFLCPCVIARLPLDGFSLSLLSGTFMKICRENSNLV